jgi:hypothetical protein
MDENDDKNTQKKEHKEESGRGFRIWGEKSTVGPFIISL